MQKETLEKFMIEELKLIQDIIKRMASNSFALKGWAVTLIVGTLLLKGDKYQAFIAFIPAIIFWYLDAYFLWQEKLYRELYKWVVHNRLNTDEFLFDMNAYRFKSVVKSTFRIMFSKTLRLFYGSIVVLIFVYIIFLFKGESISSGVNPFLHNFFV